MGFNYDATNVAALPGFDVTPYGGSYGGRVGLGDVSGEGWADLLPGAGRDPASSAMVKPVTTARRSRRSREASTRSREQPMA